MPHKQAARPGEFELIARLKAVLDEPRSGATEPPPEPIIGIGDDCAAVQRGSVVDIYTTDTMVDGVHFRSGSIPWFDLGWKSMVSNQSDIASMGAAPLYALVTLGVTASTPADGLEEAYRGLKAASEQFGGRCIGGDVVSSPVLFLTVALTGTAVMDAEGHPLLLRRDTAREGDLIAVTGPLGSSAGGLRAIDGNLKSNASDKLKRAHFAPEPRVRDGQSLAVAGVRTAMDISDGLVADLEKLAESSGVGAVIESHRVPVDGALRETFPRDHLQLALGGGEDYELLFTASEDLMEQVMNALPSRAAVIGRVVKAPENGHERIQLIDENGNPLVLEHRGWNHLRG